VALEKISSPFNMKAPVRSTLSTRSLQPAPNITCLLREAIRDQIETIIIRQPTCPSEASAEADRLLLTLDRIEVE
jgi:hypothetical protein